MATDYENASRRLGAERRHEPVRRPARAWREEVTFFSGLNILAGIWLIIAPWVLNYSSRDPRWNDVVFGAIVGLLAFARIGGGLRDAWLSVVNAAIGVWIFIAAFAIDVTRTAEWNDIILGAIVFLLAIGSASAGGPRAVER